MYSLFYLLFYSHNVITLSRGGAANTVLNHPRTLFNLIPVGLRGGWEMTNVTRMFEYVNLLLAITAAGKVLAAYSNPFNTVHLPKLYFFDECHEKLRTIVFYIIVELYVPHCP